VEVRECSEHLSRYILCMSSPSWQQPDINCCGKVCVLLDQLIPKICSAEPRKPTLTTNFNLTKPQNQQEGVRKRATGWFTGKMGSLFTKRALCGHYYHQGSGQENDIYPLSCRQRHVSTLLRGEKRKKKEIQLHTMYGDFRITLYKFTCYSS
jgi:hypothetical protein